MSTFVNLFVDTTNAQLPRIPISKTYVRYTFFFLNKNKVWITRVLKKTLYTLCTFMSYLYGILRIY